MACVSAQADRTLGADQQSVFAKGPKSDLVASKHHRPKLSFPANATNPQVLVVELIYSILRIANKVAVLRIDGLGNVAPIETFDKSVKHLDIARSIPDQPRVIHRPTP